MKTLWYSSTPSTSMGHDGRQATPFPGIFSCVFDESTGRCLGSAETLVDTTFINGDRQRGAHLSNVRLNARENYLFALRTDSLWEILWAPLDSSNTNDNTSSSPISLQSYFRIPKLIYTDKAQGQECGKYNGTRFAYFEVLPVAFVVDENNDVFISWEGYFQDCDDMVESANGLVWSIGINKVDQKCAMSDNIQSFDQCTSPYSIFYRGLLGKDHRLGNGLDMSSSPANRQLFYLTVVNRAYGVDNTNELWVAPPGIHKRPSIVPTPQMPSTTGYQATRIIPDVASIRLNLDDNKLPRSVCQTAYTKGVYCFSFQIDDDGQDVIAHSEDTGPIFAVSEDVVADSCTIDTNVNEGEEYMSRMTTGLEVIWGSDNRPEVVLFGCYGRLPDRGNMTAVFRDGSVTQILPGAYPGSLLFGTNITNPGRGAFLSDMQSVQGKDDTGINTGIIVSIVISIAIFVSTVAFLYSFARNNKLKDESNATSLERDIQDENSPKRPTEILVTIETSQLDDDSVETGMNQ